MKEEEIKKIKDMIDNNDDIYKLGLTEAKTPFGNAVKSVWYLKVYLWYYYVKKRMDIEHVKYIIREYIKRKDKDLIKLSKYANKMGIKKDVMDLLEWFYE